MTPGTALPAPPERRREAPARACAGVARSNNCRNIPKLPRGAEGGGMEGGGPSSDGASEVAEIMCEIKRLPVYYQLKRVARAEETKSANAVGRLTKLPQ